LVLQSTGTPMALSSVPSQLGDVNEEELATLFGRLRNALQTVLGNHYFPQAGAHATTQVFHRKFGPNFPSIEEILRNVSLHVNNLELLVDFPRPFAPHVINVGGITVPSTSNAELPKEWKEVLERRPRAALVSFGSVAKSSAMPADYKVSLKETMKAFPDVTFIWKYEEEEAAVDDFADAIRKDAPNVVLTQWMPQMDILAHPNLAFFISHGGTGSILEAITRGVPMVMIPLFGDHHRNAVGVARRGAGLVLRKGCLSSTVLLQDAIREILKAERRKAARDVAFAISRRPFTPREVFSRHIHWVLSSSSSSLPATALTPLTTKQSFVQVYFVDALLLFSTITALLVFTIFSLSRRIVYSSKVKTKRQ